jgi:hypothetical protein
MSRPRSNPPLHPLTDALMSGKPLTPTASSQEQKKSSTSATGKLGAFFTKISDKLKGLTASDPAKKSDKQMDFR